MTPISFAAAAMRLANVAFLLQQNDPTAYDRIIVALSRAMAEDPSSDCRYMAAYALESHVTGRGYVDQPTGRLCEPFWKKATADGNEEVAERAKDYMAWLAGKHDAPR